MTFTIANDQAHQHLASLYIRKGVEPYQAFLALQKAKYMVKGYKFNGRKVMAKMFHILNKQG